MKNRSLRKKATPYCFLAPTLILMVVFLVVPIFNVIRFSFFDKAFVKKNPDFIGWANYETVLNDEVFWLAAKNTVFFVLLSIVAHIILALIFAHLLNSNYFKTRTKTVARVFYVLPWIFTATVVAVMWKLMFQPQGIVDYLLSFVGLADKHTEWFSNREIALYVVTFINMWSGYPFYMISVLAGLQGISPDLYESAAIDGATSLKSFRFITIPQLKPILTSLVMLDFVWTLQSFAIVWTLTSGGPLHATEMLSLYIYKTAFMQSDYSLAAAAAVLLLIVCVIASIFYTRQQFKIQEG